MKAAAFWKILMAMAALTAITLSGCTAQEKFMCPNSVCETDLGENAQTCPADCAQPAPEPSQSAESARNNIKTMRPTPTGGSITLSEEAKVSYPCKIWFASALGQPAQLGLIKNEETGEEYAPFDVTGAVKYTGDCAGNTLTVKTKLTPLIEGDDPAFSKALSNAGSGFRSVSYSLGRFKTTGMPGAQCFEADASAAYGVADGSAIEVGIAPKPEWCEQYRCKTNESGEKICEKCDITTEYSKASCFREACPTYFIDSFSAAGYSYCGIKYHLQSIVPTFDSADAPQSSAAIAKGDEGNGAPDEPGAAMFSPAEQEITPAQMQVLRDRMLQIETEFERVAESINMEMRDRVEFEKGSKGARVDFGREIAEIGEDEVQTVNFNGAIEKRGRFRLAIDALKKEEPELVRQIDELQQKIIDSDDDEAIDALNKQKKALEDALAKNRRLQGVYARAIDKLSAARNAISEILKGKDAKLKSLRSTESAILGRASALNKESKGLCTKLLKSGGSLAKRGIPILAAIAVISQMPAIAKDIENKNWNGAAQKIMENSLYYDIMVGIGEQGANIRDFMTRSGNARQLLMEIAADTESTFTPTTIDDMRYRQMDSSCDPATQKRMGELAIELMNEYENAKKPQ